MVRLKEGSLVRFEDSRVWIVIEVNRFWVTFKAQDGEVRKLYMVNKNGKVEN